MSQAYKWFVRIFAVVYFFMIAVVFAAHQQGMNSGLSLLLTLFNLGCISYMIYGQGRERGRQDIIDALTEKDPQ